MSVCGRLVNRCDYIDSVGGEGTAAGTPKDTQGHCPETLYGGGGGGDTLQRMSIVAKIQGLAGPGESNISTRDPISVHCW